VLTTKTKATKTTRLHSPNLEGEQVEKVADVVAAVARTRRCTSIRLI
jgi:hypothetical protein